MNATMQTILVTGATGHLGRGIVEHLLRREPGRQIAAMARDPAKLADLAARGVEPRAGNYADPSSLDHAFTDVDTLMFVSSVVSPDRLAQQRNVVEAARRAGVRRVVYTSIQRRDGSTFEIPGVTDVEPATEALLANTGLGVTVLRNCLYLDSLTMLLGPDALSSGLRVPAGTAPAALALRDELAEGAAAVLLGHGHEGRIYTLGGSEAYSLSEIATALSRKTGMTIDYEDVPVPTYVAALVAHGFPEPMARFAATWFAAIAASVFAEVTGDLERLIGRKPRDAAEAIMGLLAPADRPDLP